MPNNAEETNWKTIEGYRAAAARIEREPDNPAAWRIYAESRQFRGEVAEAALAFRRAADLDPADRVARLRLARALADASIHGQGRDEGEAFERGMAEAEEIFRGLTAVSATAADARLGLARLAMWRGDVAEAFDLARRVITYFPDKAGEAWDIVSVAPWSFPERLELLKMALAADHSPAFRARALLSVPEAEMEEGDGVLALERIRRHVDSLSENPEQFALKPWEMGLPYVLNVPEYCADSFLPLRSKLTSLLRRTCPELNFVSFRAARAAARPRPARLRLGVVVFRSKSLDFASILANIFRNIDKRRFEIVFFYNDRSLAENAYSREVDALADEKIVFPLGDWIGYCRTIADAAVDVLLHEACIASTAFTGFARLAPVQVSFSDPAYSLASPRQDYVLRMGDMEYLRRLAPCCAEKVALTGRPVIAVDPARAEPVEADLSEFGIPADATLLFSWQRLNRWLARDDEFIASLLRRRPGAWLLARHETYMATALTERRWREKTLADVMDRVRFFHYLPLPRFFGMVRRADVILASPNDAGLISTQTALGLAVPVPAFMPSNPKLEINSLFYRTMNVDGLVARDRGEFARLLDRLLDDPEWRAEKSREIREKSPAIFDARPGVLELQDFLEAAHERARQGLPPAHWCGGAFIEHPDF